MLTIQTNKPVVFQGQSLQPYCRYLFPPRTVADLYPALLADGAAHKAPGSFNSYERRYSSCMDAKRVLLYRHYAIGDQLICTGLAKWFADNRPEMHLDVCTHARVAALWEGHDVGLYMAPLTFEAARGYDAHILLEGMLESNCEEDQNNCYDDMFAWCGIDPETVDAKYKRPWIYPQKADEYHCEIMDPYILVHWNAGCVTRTYPEHRMMELLNNLYDAFPLAHFVVVGRAENAPRLPSTKRFRDHRNMTPRFRNLLPSRGSGSRGGQIESIQLEHGVTLKWMGAVGSDKSKSGFTSPIAVLTEIDGMDEAKSNSRETAPLGQIEARTRAYKRSREKRFLMECTVSLETGATWVEYQNSTKSFLVVPCGDCEAWVTPEREHLVGWQGADTVKEARDNSRIACPSCGSLWDDDARDTAFDRSRLLHEGQTVDEAGEIEGEDNGSETFGFRCNGAGNKFNSLGDIGAEEWEASRAEDPESKEMELCQFVWSVPYRPKVETDGDVTVAKILSLRQWWAQGSLPEGTIHCITVGADIGKHRIHWVAMAWDVLPRAHVIDYGVIDLRPSELGVEAGIVEGLDRLRGKVIAGWHGVVPERVLVDSGYQTDTVELWAHEKPLFFACMGFGQSTQIGQKYRHRKVDRAVVRAGLHYHFVRHRTRHQQLTAQCDADYWKSWFHRRVEVEAGTPGSLTLPAGDHSQLARHYTSEVREARFVKGQGIKEKWVQKRRSNHLLDCTYLACVAGHDVGVRIPGQTEKPEEEQEKWWGNKRSGRRERFQKRTPRW